MAGSKQEIADGPKAINVPAKLEDNPAYSLIINNLVPGLVYEIKVSVSFSVIVYRFYYD